MENVAAGQSELALQIQRRQYFACNHRILEVWRVPRHGINDMIGRFFADVVPGQVVWQFGAEMLAEQAGHMLPGRRQRIVNGRRDQQFHHRRT